MKMLTSAELCGLIIGAQAAAPNWWWSIHQSEGDIELRAGPTTAADLTSRKLMMTREGDEGVFVTGTVASFVLHRFQTAVADLIENHVPDIKADDVKPRTLDGRDCGVYRPETRGNLSKLFSAFSQLQLPEGVEVREVMFGCCPTSLDCSIRLTNGLDLSIDLLDHEATLDGVFQAALAPFQARMPKVS